jgi:hypothetical protein
VGILITLGSLPCASFQKQDFNDERGSQPQSNLNISLDGLLRVLNERSGNDSSEAMAIRLIDMYGLSFRPTPEDMEKLKKASVSEDFLRAIEGARMPPPKPIVKQGQLAVSCEPVDCDVSVNGEWVGTTSHGQAHWNALAEGTVMVSASKENYDSSQSKQEAVIRQNELTRVKFQFRISRAGLMQMGKKLFEQMRQSMRSPAQSGTPPETGTLRAAGTLYLYDSGGHRAVSSVVAWFQEGHAAWFELSRLRERYVLTQTATGGSWNRTPPAKEAREIESLTRLVTQEQLPGLLERLDEPGLTMVAVESPLGSANAPVFRAEGGSQTYLVTLNAASRPSEIKEESGRRMLYSDYVQLGSGYYPKTTQIILPDGAQGVEARFDTVQIGSLPKSYQKMSSKHSKAR